MKILFMGTPDIAAQSLQQLINSGHEICAVFTREDKPVGRKQILTAPPVKQLAEKVGIKIYQPKTLKDDSIVNLIKQISPEIIIVVAYGRILPKVILDIPPKGCINLHVSLLPKYRGSAPIQWAVLNGDEETGISIMYMDEGIDTGDVLKTVKVKIGENETSGELFEKVSRVGAEALCNTLQEISANKINRLKQNHALATSAPSLNKEQAKINFNIEYTKFHNLVRGYNPWPVAYFEHDGKKIKILRTLKCDAEGNAGEILSLNPFVVACKNGAVELCDIIPEGSKQMTATQWAMGKRLSVGDII